MSPKPLSHALFLALLLPLTAAAQPAETPKNAQRWEAPKPEEKVVTTRHRITVGGAEVAYTANAGTLLLKEEDGRPRASIFFVAYTRDGVKDVANRPVTFTFNGGPGSSSVWLHLGTFGPRRVVMDDEGLGAQPPGRLADNADSLLDVSDLVFIDPVSTGFSRAVPGEDPGKFHGCSRTSSRWESSSVSGRPATAAGRRPSTWPARATARRAPPVSPTISRSAMGCT